MGTWARELMAEYYYFQVGTVGTSATMFSTLLFVSAQQREGEMGARCVRMVSIKCPVAICWPWSDSLLQFDWISKLFSALILL